MPEDVTQSHNGVMVEEESCTSEMFLRRRNRKALIAIMLVCIVVGFVCFGVFTSAKIFPKRGRRPSNQFEAYLQGDTLHEHFEAHELYRNHPFTIEGDDVLVFLHIQKTGGTTFGKHLVKNLEIPIPCSCRKGRKRCDCLNSQQEVWLFSRYSTGWACGLHADWTELHSCINPKMDHKEHKQRDRRYYRLGHFFLCYSIALKWVRQSGFIA